MTADLDTTERAKIEDVIANYFRGYLNAESHLVAQAFHPETRLFSVEDGALEKAEMPEWLKNLDDRKEKGDVRKAKTEIVTVDITSSAAMAKVRISFPKFRFTDYLSFLKIEEQWRIIGKIYTAETLK